MLLLVGGSGRNDDLTPQEQRGKHIYRTGTSASGRDITAVLGEQGTGMPASLLPCITCHGPDGRGKPEGGVMPADLTWEALTKPYALQQRGGRTRPPYTEQRLKRAITMGIDAGGEQLDRAMPRYQLSHEDLDDLIAYLKKMGTERDPGVTETHLRVGVMLAPRASMGATHDAVRAVLTAYFDEVNQRGGVYGRHIDLQFAEAPEAVDERVAAAQAFLDAEAPFALVLPFFVGADSAMAALATERSVPVIGAYSLHPQVAFPLNRQVFYLYSGLADQGRALVRFAVRQRAGSSPPAALIHTETLVDVADAIEAEAQQQGWVIKARHRASATSFDVEALAATLHEQETEVIFWLGPAGQERELLEAAEALAWAPALYLPGALAGPGLFDLPRRFDGHLFLAFPTLPLDQTDDALRAYARLAEVHGLPAEHRPAQWRALASAMLFVEGIRQVGKDVTREKLITALEGFYEFQTGLTPPLTYGPNRRVGAQGAYVVIVDLEQRTLVPVGGWIGVP